MNGHAAHKYSIYPEPTISNAFKINIAARRMLRGRTPYSGSNLFSLKK